MINPNIFIINNTLALLFIIYVYCFLYASFSIIINAPSNYTLPFSSSSIDNVVVNI